jgi:4-hydroxy-tetrahydrodipicolinate synthase
VPKIHGIIAYPVTPFTTDAVNTIDTATLAALVGRLVSSGVHAIAPLGSTAELAYLEEGEFDAVVDTTMATVDGRVPVVVGVLDLTTAKTIRRAQYAQQAGADAVMVLPVSYWKLSDREIRTHYCRIGGAIGIPIMVYNNPATSGVDMPPNYCRMRRIAELSDARLPFFKRQQSAGARCPEGRRLRMVHRRSEPASAALHRPRRRGARGPPREGAGFSTTTSSRCWSS